MNDKDTALRPGLGSIRSSSSLELPDVAGLPSGSIGIQIDCLHPLPVDKSGRQRSGKIGSVSGEKATRSTPRERLIADGIAFNDQESLLHVVEEDSLTYFVVTLTWKALTRKR